MAAPGRSGIRVCRSASSALWVNLGVMRIKGLVWQGIPAGDYAAAIRFFGETLGLEVAFDEGNTVEPAAANGDRIQRSGPATATSFSAAARTPVLSRRSRWTWIRRAPSRPGGNELLGEPESNGAWNWLTFRRPMGTSTAWAPAWRSCQARRSARTRAIWPIEDVHPERGDA